MAITRALVQRHAGKASYEAALLDVAQDHLLYVLQTSMLFDRPGIVFKGGTSLRKCRLGNNGRFSTDLDLVAPDDSDVLDMCAAMDGARAGGFTFSLNHSSDSARIWALDVHHPELGNVTAEIEACAEKLARYRRTPLARDLYDLAWFAGRPMDEQTLRRLWVLKVYCDVVDDGRGTKPLSASDVLTRREAKDFPAAPIGVLTQTPDLVGWEAKVRSRFAFLAALDADEQRWALCNPRDRDEVRAVLRLLRSSLNASQ